MTEIRFGTFSSPGLFSVVKSGGNGNRCEMAGVAGESMNPILDATNNSGFNCTIKIYDAMGAFDKESGDYSSGILGALVHDEIDYSAMTAYYPLEGDSENVEQSAMYAEDTMTLISGYNIRPEDKGESVDILELYTDIPIGFWILLGISYIALVILLYIGWKRWKPNSNPDSIWISTCAFLDQDHFPESTFFIASLSMVTSVSLFFVMNYALNMMGTDLVVVEKPSVIASYQDVIDKNGSVASSPLTPELDKFYDAPPGSLEWELSKNIRNMDFDAMSIPKLRYPFAKQKIVFIGREVFIDSVSIYMINSFDQDGFHDFRILRVKDAHAQKFTSSCLWNRKSDPKFQQLVTVLNQRMQATGILIKMYSDIPLRMVEFAIGKITPSMERKVTRFVEEQQVDFVPIGLHNLTLVTKLYFAFIVLAIGAIFFEIIFRRQMTKKRNGVAIVKRGE